MNLAVVQGRPRWPTAGAHVCAPATAAERMPAVIKKCVVPRTGLPHARPV